MTKIVKSPHGPSRRADFLWEHKKKNTCIAQNKSKSFRFPFGRHLKQQEPEVSCWASSDRGAVLYRSKTNVNRYKIIRANSSVSYYKTRRWNRRDITAGLSKDLDFFFFIPSVFRISRTSYYRNLVKMQT